MTEPDTLTADNRHIVRARNRDLYALLGTVRRRHRHRVRQNISHPDLEPRQVVIHLIRPRTIRRNRQRTMRTGYRRLIEERLASIGIRNTQLTRCRQNLILDDRTRQSPLITGTSFVPVIVISDAPARTIQ